ncbi:hypothetical protein BS47DRAFT_677400 [Hydnum rufescens UP504]|uniref:Uncharacterized protein n=1 Tax=Hydnum rufescens UP504 TaxID=1448309 RepID=A0A9P6B269_9AGAM|nr:hypothetical protein BS47DRAFT_677400 [Hydnum rufescens UP504]
MLKSAARLEQSAQDLALLHRTSSSSLPYSHQKRPMRSSSGVTNTTTKTSTKATTLLAQYTNSDLLALDQLEDSCDDEPVSPAKILASSQLSAPQLCDADEQTSNDMGDHDLDDLMMQLSDGHLQRLQGLSPTPNNKASNVRTQDVLPPSFSGSNVVSLKRNHEELHRRPSKRIAIDLTSSPPSPSSFRNSRSPSPGNRMVLVRRNGVSVSPSRLPPCSPKPRFKGPLFLASPLPGKLSDNSTNEPLRGSISREHHNFSQTSSQTILDDSRDIRSSALKPSYSEHDVHINSVLEITKAMEYGFDYNPAEDRHTEVLMVSEPRSEDWDDIEKWMADNVDIVD